MLKLLLAALLIAQIAATAPAPLDAVAQSRLGDDLRCQLGVYALPGKRAVTLTGADGGPRGLRYTLSNGQFATMQEGAPGVFTAGPVTIQLTACAAGALTISHGKAVETAARVALIEQPTTFTSDDVALYGKLVLPAKADARALAVWIEGSNNNPSTDDAIWQYESARRGVAVFVYDKRGTGKSGGALSADFNIRARDTAAAVREAKRLAPKVRRVGVIGASQGGWVAPLTATLTPLDFVIPVFALAQSPIAQDQELVQLQLRQAGFGAEALAQAAQLTAITERIVRTNADDAFEDLDAFKAKHAQASWLKVIQPRSYTGLFLMFPSEQIKAVGPAMAQGLKFDFEPRPVIEAVTARQLWLLAGADTQAPSGPTQAILRDMQRSKANLSVVVFPKADHGLVEEIKFGTETAWAYAPRLFDVAADWIKANKLPAAGSFIVMSNGR